MGTRNMTYVYLNDEKRIAQYGQWDGYPTGQGATAVGFLKNKDNITALVDRLCAEAEYLNVRFLTESELKEVAAVWEKHENKDDAMYKLLCQSVTSRDIGANVLYHVAYGINGMVLWDYTECDDYDKEGVVWIEGRTRIYLYKDGKNITGRVEMDWHGQTRSWDIYNLPTLKELREFEDEALEKESDEKDD